MPDSGPAGRDVFSIIYIRTCENLVYRERAKSVSPEAEFWEEDSAGSGKGKIKSGRQYGGNAPAEKTIRLGGKNERKQIMEVRALTKNVRISPEKARHMSRLIQGKSVVEALAIVDLSPRKAAALIGKTLRSAVANAENNMDVNRKVLTVKAALVSPGPIIRRFRAKARGSAGRIRKRTSHFEVVLTDN